MITETPPIIPTHQQRDALRYAASVLQSDASIPNTHATSEELIFASLLPTWQTSVVARLNVTLKQQRRILMQQGNVDFWVENTQPSDASIDSDYFDLVLKIVQERVRQANVLTAAITLLPTLTVSSAMSPAG